MRGGPTPLTIQHRVWPEAPFIVFSNEQSNVVGIWKRDMAQVQLGGNQARLKTAMRWAITGFRNVKSYEAEADVKTDYRMTDIRVDNDRRTGLKGTNFCSVFKPCFIDAKLTQIPEANKTINWLHF